MRRSACNRLPAARRPSLPYAAVADLIDSALVHPRASLPSERAKHQMAEDFRSQGGHGLTREDLLRLGWTAAQIDALSGPAILRAQQLAGPAL